MTLPKGKRCLSTCRRNPKERTSLFIISVRCWRQPNVCSAVPRSAVSVLPGAYVPGGSRKVVACGPVWVWSVIGLAILKDRSKGACLFVKDAGTYGDDSTTEGEAIGFLGILRKATNSIALCGEDQDVIYDRIYIGYKYTFVEPGQVGCALSCTPAVYMAQMLFLPI